METCWDGPSPRAGRSSEVLELEFTKLKMGLGMKTKGLVRESLLCPTCVEVGALVHSGHPWDLVSEHEL